MSLGSYSDMSHAQTRDRRDAERIKLKTDCPVATIVTQVYALSTSRFELGIGFPK
jgi:hypothetical protein